MKLAKKLLGVSIAVGLGMSSSAYATNGMNMDGWGPISTAMGGTGYAFDHGAGAMMANPATLGLMADGTSLMQLAIGNLGPDVDASIDHPQAGKLTASSGGDSYWMPAAGWVTKSGKLAYGLGVFAQGGMGTDYTKNTFLAAGSGRDVRSELGIGRLMAPLAYDVNDKFTIAGSIDFVWASMDLKMAVPTAQLGGLVDMGKTNPNWYPVLGQLGQADWGRFDFSNNSPWYGKANGTGFAGKIGFTYEFNPQWTIGAVYHTETSLGDMETSSGSAHMSAGLAPNNPNNPTGAPLEVAAFKGKIRLDDFQWPSTLGFGVAFRPNDDWLLSVDIKRYAWNDVMDTFRMTYIDPNLGKLAVALPQDWDDQTVYALGLAYKVNDALTLRAGASIADNPIPDSFVNALFPAITENHYSVGFGYAFNEMQAVDFSFTYVDEKDVTSGDGIDISHSQTNWQLMYSHRF